MRALAGTATRRLRVIAVSAVAAVAPLVVGACAGGPGPGSTRPAIDDPLEGLDTYISQAIADWGIAGVSIAVVKGDQVVYADGHGVRDVDGGAQVDENTLFAIGSNTKVFTAVAAGMMVDEGRMSWDDRVTLHLPGFRLYDPYVSREMTVRDLLSHRSGLGRRGDLLWYGSEYDRSEVIDRVRHLEPNSSFRSEYGYQNVMFLAAGEATAAAAGASWDEIVEDRIFTPLGMARSNTSTRALTGDSNVASPHIRVADSLVVVPWRNIDNIAPAGSINSSAREMAEWLRVLLSSGTRGQDTLIQPATLEEIFTPQTILPLAPDTLFPSVHFRAYGLGLVTQDYRGRKLLWHTGGIDGMLSAVGIVPEEDVGVVVLTNTTGHNNLHVALMYRALDSYLGGAERDWSGIFLTQTERAESAAAEARRAREAKRVMGTSPSLDLAAYAGTYRNPVYGDAVVSLEEGGLVLRRGPGFTGDLEHWHYDTFRATWRGPEGESAAVTFRLDFTGRPDAVEVSERGRFDRQENEAEEEQ